VWKLEIDEAKFCEARVRAAVVDLDQAEVARRAGAELVSIVITQVTAVGVDVNVGINVDIAAMSIFRASETAGSDGRLTDRMLAIALQDVAVFFERGTIKRENFVL